MSACRLISDHPSQGDYNLAVDQALLATANSTGQATLRLYRWSQPTLSLGYFQSLADRESHSSSLACPVVRRQSGGGAIIHDREITYSLTLPLPDRSSKAGNDLYDRVHTATVHLMKRLGVEAAIVDSAAARGGASFLCFQRHCAGDIVVGTHKVVGSAQRRFRQAILQHGSFLLRRSAAAPELPGLMDLASPAADAEELANLWSDSMVRALHLTPRPASLTEAECDLVNAYAAQRFAHARWTGRR